MRGKNGTQVETLFDETCRKIDNTGLPTIIQSGAYVSNANPARRALKWTLSLLIMIF
jgi:hypothetical protein